jgi:hypothetical protein
MKGTKLFAGLFVVAVMVVVFVSSCSKSTTNPNAAFIGTYYGTETDVANTITDTITITAGSSSSAIALAAKTSAGTSYPFTATVSGSALTIPMQPIDYTTTSYTIVDSISGSGSLTGSTLQMNYTIKTSGGSPNWQYTGTKQ